MPVQFSLLEKCFFTTIQLNGVDDEENEITATAFFFSYRSKGKEHLFLDPNGHSVKYMQTCTLQFHSRKRGRLELDKTVNLIIEDFWRNWHHHPNDLDLGVVIKSGSLKTVIHGYLNENENMDLRSSLTKRIRDTLGLNLLPLPLFK